MPVGSPRVFFDFERSSTPALASAAAKGMPSGGGIYEAFQLPSCCPDESLELPLPGAAKASAGKIEIDLSNHVLEKGMCHRDPGLVKTSNASTENDLIVVHNKDYAESTGKQNTVNDNRFKCFAENSSNAILITDISTGNIDYISPAAMRIWVNQSPIKTVNDWETSIHPDDRVFAIERRALVKQGFHQKFRYRLIDSGGRIARHVRETSFPMTSLGGEIDCIGAIIESISPEMPIYLVQSMGAKNSSIVDALRDTAYRVTTFSSYNELMNVAEVLHPGCVIIDLHYARTTPASLLQLLGLRPAELQIILAGPEGTQSADVIDALRAGAADYLIYPITSESLVGALQKAGHSLPDDLTVKEDAGEVLRERLTSLPIREREVFLGLVGGGTNKSIARKLELSPRTVEVHRAHLMQRLNVRTLTELLHFAHDAGIKATV